MFDPNCNHDARSHSHYGHANWEFDICDISIENCEVDEDPLGYRVVFYRAPDAECYAIGASHLSARLKKLSRAGFDAPMTEKALNIIDRKRLRVLPRAV